MPSLLTLASTFTIEEEESLDLDALLNLIESRIRSLDGVWAAAADLAESTRTYTLLIQVEGEGVDMDQVEWEAEGAIKETLPKLENVRHHPPLVDEVS